MSCFSQNNSENIILDRLDENIELSFDVKILNTIKVDSLKKYFDLLNNISNDSTRLRNKFKIVNSLIFIKEDSLEKKFINEIKTEALNIDNVYNIARAYNYLGDYHLKHFALDSALFYINKSEKLFLKINDPVYLSYCYNSKANIYTHINDYNKALEYNFKALRQSDSTLNKRTLFFAYQSVFITLGKLQNQDKAFEYYKKALNVLEQNKTEFKHNYTSFLAQTHNFMGSVYINTEDYEKAKELYQKALAVPDIQQVFPSLYAALLDNLAYAQYKASNTVTAQEDLEYALRLKDSLGKSAIAIQTRLRLAEVLYAKKDLAQSYQYAQEAFNDAQTHSIVEEQLEALQWLAKTAPQKQDQYFQDYINLKDSLINAERIQRNKFARIEYETQELEKQNALAQLNNERLFRQNIIIYASSAILLLTLSLLYINYRRKAQKKIVIAQQSEKQIQEEIMDMMLHQEQSLAQAKVDEQNRISRDLHDEVSGQLSALNLQMHVFNRKTLKEQYQEFGGFMSGLQKLQKRVREISHDLSQEKHFEAMDFGLAVKGLVEPLKQDNIKTEIQYAIDFEWHLVSTKIKLEIFKILQEAIANILKYAKANTVIIKFSIEDNQFEMCITDDGVGFNTSAKSKGIGFKNMRERAKRVKGSIDISSKIGQGTKIIFQAKLPKVERQLF
ncbi:tetratricopeptide repeat-containing sensor histidine kinase [Psychroflexus sp. MBR-150]